MFAIWAHRVANLELDSLEIKTATNRFVCDDHFAPICKGSLYNRSTLKVDALPTLKLPGGTFNFFKQLVFLLYILIILHYAGYNGNPYSKNNCLIDRDTFSKLWELYKIVYVRILFHQNILILPKDSGHSLRAPHNRGKLWGHFRKIGASLNNNGSAITLGKYSAFFISCNVRIMSIIFSQKLLHQTNHKDLIM